MIISHDTVTWKWTHFDVNESLNAYWWMNGIWLCVGKLCMLYVYLIYQQLHTIGSHNLWLNVKRIVRKWSFRQKVGKIGVEGWNWVIMQIPWKLGPRQVSLIIWNLLEPLVCVELVEFAFWYLRHEKWTCWEFRKNCELEGENEM